MDIIVIDYVKGTISKVRKNGSVKEIKPNDRGYTRFTYNKELIYAHRFLYENYHNIKLNPNDIIDHINKDKTNNSINNLRMVSVSQNIQNRGRAKNNTTGFIGVCKLRDKYAARIRVDKKMENLGCFDTPEDAAKCRDERAKKLNATGQYCFTLNFSY